MREDLFPAWDKNLVALIINYVVLSLVFMIITTYLYIIQQVRGKIKAGDVVINKIGLQYHKDYWSAPGETGNKLGLSCAKLRPAEVAASKKNFLG